MRRAWPLLVLLALVGCGDDLGPLLSSGPWYGYVLDANQNQIGTITFTADTSNNVQVHIEGMLSDGTPFQFEVGGQGSSVTREGSDFNISGSVMGNSVSGYGRQRVFDYMLEVIIPVDGDPAHQLMVGNVPWNFGIEGAVNPNGGQGIWNAQHALGNFGLAGYWVIAPGIAPDGGADAMIENDGGVDAPVDAGTD